MYALTVAVAAGAPGGCHVRWLQRLCRYNSVVVLVLGGVGMLCREIKVGHETDDVVDYTDKLEWLGLVKMRCHLSVRICCWLSGYLNAAEMCGAQLLKTRDASQLQQTLPLCG